MFIQTEDTPNPATLKFLPGRAVTGDRPPADFPNKAAAEASPLAEALFTVDGVESVFLGSDFIAVTKGAGEWQLIKPALLQIIMSHFVEERPVLLENAAGADVQDVAEADGPDAEIISVIKQIIDTRVRPAVAQDGGDIVFHGYDDGVVSLHMRGACAGCPSATATLKHGIENLLKHYVPSVTEVRAVI
ncbi:MAG: NifU family protein [Alphaproteobacteria bacterium]|nr:NifU family protein [Alphaproteobacteria bacterium]